MFPSSPLSPLLSLISLMPGDTLIATAPGKYAAVPHKSWSTAWHRHRHSETRWRTVRYVDEILSILETADAGLSLHDLEQAAVGLQNLQQTYAHDAEVCREFEKRRQKILSFVMMHRDVDRPHRLLSPLPCPRTVLIT